MRRIHGRVPAWRWFGLALVLFALARHTEAQQFGPPRPAELPVPESVKAEFEALLPLLADPRATDDAIGAIRDLGPDAVPLLRAAIREAETTHLPRLLLLGSLRTLGMMEGNAVDALPELLARLGDDDLEVHRQVLWSLTRIAAYATKSQQDAIVAAWLHSKRRRTNDTESNRLAECLDEILVLAREKDPQAVFPRFDSSKDIRYCGERGLLEMPHREACCLWLRAHPELWLRTPASVVAFLRREVHEDLRGRNDSNMAIDYDLLRAPGSAILAATRLALEPCVVDVPLARAMLNAPDVDQRRCAIAVLEAEAPQLTSECCTDLCALLWDPDPSMPFAVVRTLRNAGPNALAALAALRHAANTVDEPALRVQCDSTANAIVAAFEGADDRVRETIVGFDRMVRLGVLVDSDSVHSETWTACVRGLAWGPPEWVELVRTSCLLPRTLRMTFFGSDWYLQAERVRAWLRDGRRGPCMDFEFLGRWTHCSQYRHCPTPLFPTSPPGAL